MVTEVILPKLGQTMEEGVIVEWFKKEGEQVKRGDLLFSVESDKATLDVEATARGFLRRILAPAGEAVPVLTVVALMTRTADESLEGYDSVSTAVGDLAEQTDPAGRLFASPRARMRARELGVDLAQVTGSGPNGRIKEQDVLAYQEQAERVRPKVTPVAAKVAQALEVDVAAVQGSGPGGRVTKADVEAVASQSRSSCQLDQRQLDLQPATETTPMSGVRRVIAERMAASARTTARVTLVTEADATEFVAARERVKSAVAERWGFAPGYNDLLALIVARALGEFPYMNARLSADETVIERVGDVNLGVAVDTERGLLVPVIRHADRMGLRELGTELRALIERARAGRSLPDELSGGTFTITNLGMYDIDAFTPIINLPEAAILGVGRIQPKVVPREGEIVVRQMWTLSLVFDHRLVDGAPAARFLQRVKQLIEDPYLLLG